MIKQQRFIRWMIVLGICWLALGLQPISEVFAQQEISLQQAIENGIVTVQIQGREARFIEPMLQLELELTDQAQAETTIIIPQGLIFKSQDADNYTDIIMAEEARVLLQPNDRETLPLFAYSLDIDESFPSQEIEYEVGEVKEDDSELIRILQQIESAGAKAELAAQLAVWMHVHNMSFDDVEEKLGVDLNNYRERALSFRESTIEPTSVSTIDLRFGSVVVVAFLIVLLLLLVSYFILHPYLIYFPYRFMGNEPIATGGMAEIWKGKDIFGNFVAIKFCTRQKERFHRETAIHRAFRHANIVSVLKSGEGPNPDTKFTLAYMVMKYIDGCSLRELIDKKGALPPEFVLEIALQVLSALEYLHNRCNPYVIHRDIKPSNILLNVQGNVYVNDFGIAWRKGDIRHTPDGPDGVGRAPYNAPEVLTNQQDFDHRADIYSLGVLIVEMYVGQVTSDVPPFKTLIQQFPQELQNIVQPCVCKEKEKRYQSVNEIQALLFQLHQEDQRSAVRQRLGEFVAKAKSTTNQTQPI